MRLISLALLLLTLNACSLNQMMVRASTPLIEGGITALNRETDLDLAEDSIPTNIELLEGMIQIDPNNAKLHTYAAQAYYGLAFGFNEDHRPERASAFYIRGLNHGIIALELNGARDLKTVAMADYDQQVSNMDEADVPAMFWTASNWGKWIDLHRDSTASLAQLPRPTSLMQRVIELQEDFYFGGAHMYFGVYYGSRAPVLGGNYKKSRQHFNKAREITNNKLLMPDLLQAQYLARQQLDYEDFEKRLTGVVNAPDDLYPDAALINQIAKRKAMLLLQTRKASEWF
jgi:tetratricopeptide (TPR) repeat protein